MRRVLPAFILALFCHGVFLLWLDGEWASRDITAPKTRIVTMTMFQKESPAPAAAPVKKEPVRVKKAVPRPKVEKAVLPPPVKQKEVRLKPEPETSPLKADQPPPASPPQPRAEEQKKDVALQATPEMAAPAPRLLARGDDRANVKAVTEAVPLYQINPPPVYPVAARRRKQTGTAMLEVLVSPEGRVSELRLVKSSGHSSLDRAALKSVKKWVFKPGTKGMKKVEMWVRVPVVFQLK